MSFSDAEFEGKPRQTRHEVFLAEMDKATPCAAQVARIEPHYPKAAGGRRPHPLSVTLGIHCLQQGYGSSDPAMKEELHEIDSLRQFAGLPLASSSVPDETTILHWRHLLERHGLAKVIFETINGQLRGKGLLWRPGTIIERKVVKPTHADLPQTHLFRNKP